MEKKIVSKMLEKGSNKQTFPVDRHAGVVRACAHSIEGLCQSRAACN